MVGCLTILCVLLATACSAGQNLEEPPEIIFGQDVCDECDMIINDARFAASYVTPGGDVRRFDDIGDMFVYMQSHDEEVHRYWIADYETEDWLDAETAAYVHNPEMETPMGWGIVAFGETERAEAFMAANGGMMTTFSTLLEKVKSGALNPMSMGGHGG
jgi:copper chaperone NosL